MDPFKALIKDFWLQTISGMEGAWIILEKAIIPTLLSGRGSWIGIGKIFNEKVDKIQNEYLRNIYSCLPSTAKPAFRSQAGMMDTKHRIWMEKVCVLTEIPHTKMEQEENLAREVLREQLDQG